MPEGRCKKCNRLIYDTEKLDELQDKIECQHCHHINIFRRKARVKQVMPAPKVKAREKAKKKAEPAPEPVELVPELEPEPEPEPEPSPMEPSFTPEPELESVPEETSEEGE